MDWQQLIAQDPRFSWMQGDAYETLNNCFEPQIQCLLPGETSESAGRFGYLMRGSGTLHRAEGKAYIAAGELAGIRTGGAQGYQPSADVLEAETECQVLWFPYEALEFACYRGCWFHARLMREVRDILGVE